jgi:2-polyprenyl-6-methoxyphenol hydroxylase-like FAD-dependent oxidoreductase
MHIWDAIHEQRTRPGELLLLDRAGGIRARMPEVMMSGDVEILRGDLCRILYERTLRTTDYRFGDPIVGLEDRGDSVAVTFARGGAETFDLVVGADGLHSAVRRLAFGEERRVLRHRGYRIASFGMPNPLPLQKGAACYSAPGLGACVYAISAEKARALLVYAAGPLGPCDRDPDTQRRDLAARFAGMGWVVPRVLDSLAEAQDLYVDAIATVHVDRYSTGRIALLGDAAWGGTLGGQGTSLAIVGAYVLAHELAMASDPGAGLARYEARMRPYATRCQRGAGRAGGFFAPRTWLGLGLRNLFYGALTSPRLLGVFERMVKGAANDIALPAYPALAEI